MTNIYGKLLLGAVLYVMLSCVHCDKYNIKSVKSLPGYPINITDTEPSPGSECTAVVYHIAYTVEQDIWDELRAAITVILEDGSEKQMNPINSKDGHYDVWNKLGSDGTPKSGKKDDINIEKGNYNLSDMTISSIELMKNADKIIIEISNKNGEVVGKIEIALCPSS